MKRLILAGLVICLLATAFVGCAKEGTLTNETKPVIVIAAFGTSILEGQKNLEDADTIVRERFPGYDVRWGLTAQFIINKLRKTGQTTMFERKVPIKSVEEVYADLRKEGKTNVAVQCLLVMAGGEFSQVLMVPTKDLNVKYGYPLLFAPENIQNTVRDLSPKFGGTDTVTILCAHGNGHHPIYNAPLIEMDNYLRKNYKNAFLATVEGAPGTEQAFADARKSGCKKVKFIPLMLVAGDHITNDVMGDDPDSWKSQLGLPATAETGMGSDPAVMEIYLKSLDGVLSQF